MRAHPLLALPLLAALLSCEVPQDQDWYERPEAGATYHARGQGGTDAAVGTVLFEEAATAGGGTEVLFRTNDPAYLAPGGRTEWKIADTSVSRRQGSGTAGQGLLFAARSKGGRSYFLAVMVNTRQQYTIAKFLAGEKSVMQDWTRSGLLKSGYGVKMRSGYRRPPAATSPCISTGALRPYSATARPGAFRPCPPAGSATSSR